MEEQLNQLAVTHLLQHTLRSFCIHENSQWVYAVFWRILPRNYPPPKWEFHGGVYDRGRGNRRNWILVWEDGFCNFTASASDANTADRSPSSSSSVYGNYEYQQYHGLQPDLFFKMSHEIYNYGEGIIGKVAADHSHKWIFNEPNDQEINLLSAWNNAADSHPRTWEAQFQCGIKTIALIAVREGVIQLGSINKVAEDLSHVVFLRKKFNYIESIPGVLLPHPAYPFKAESYNMPEAWHFEGNSLTASPPEFYQHGTDHHQMTIKPSMGSLEALLSKLPSVIPIASLNQTGFLETGQSQYGLAGRAMELWGPEGGPERVAKEEVDDEEEDGAGKEDGGECGSSMSSHGHNEHCAYHHHDMNVANTCMPNNGYLAKQFNSD